MKTITKKAVSKKKAVALKPKAKKKFLSFRPQVRSRHPSHNPLRTTLPLLPFRSVVRLGSTTPLIDDVTHGGNRVECNTVAAVHNSADKLLMKKCFLKAGVKTARVWYTAANNSQFNELVRWINDQEEDGNTDANTATINFDPEFPLIAKHRRSSRGEGIYLLKTQAELDAWKRGKTLANYIIEKYHDYSREYRVHVTADGCIYTCRKMLRNDIPENQRWYRNDSNCVWITEENALFDKPSNWQAIVDECVKALKAVGLDIGACDLRVQSAKTSKGKVRKEPDFFVVEINSAPSFGERTLENYIRAIPQILKKKFVENK